MSRIFITGDTHGDIDIGKLSNKSLKSYGIELTKDDYVIIAGDFGLPFLPSDLDNYDKNKGYYHYWINWLKNKPYTILFVDGNHENHDWLNSLPIVNMFGGQVHVHPHAPNVIHLMRGQIYTIDNKTFFTMGGAASVDKIYRTEHISWWKEEMPSIEEYNTAVQNLENHNFTIDYVITHTCGTSYLNDLCSNHPKSDTLTQFFNHLEFDFNLQFKHWYFGHHHLDKNIDDKHTCIYNKIIQI